MKLNSNKDLYDYLMRLAQNLKTRNHDELAAEVEVAARQISGMSTEFLGESRVVLRKLANMNPCPLLESESNDALDVIIQLDAALDNRQK